MSGVVSYVRKFCKNARRRGESGKLLAIGVNFIYLIKNHDEEYFGINNCKSIG